MTDQYQLERIAVALESIAASLKRVTTIPDVPPDRPCQRCKGEGEHAPGVTCQACAGSGQIA